MAIKQHIAEVGTIYLNARHLPKNEYYTLDKFYAYPNPFSVHSSLYESGVIIYVELHNTDKLKEMGYPVLANIIDTLTRFNVKFIDFYENARFLNEFDTYDWDEDENNNNDNKLII